MSENNDLFKPSDQIIEEKESLEQDLYLLANLLVDKYLQERQVL